MLNILEKYQALRHHNSFSAKLINFSCSTHRESNE